jgi:DNA-binding transcriptional LysR family regulator
MGARVLINGNWYKVARIAWAVFGATALAREPFDPARDPRRHDWIAFADATSIARAAKWLKEHTDEKRVVYRINTMIGLAEAAAAGAGLVLLPCYVGTAVPGSRSSVHHCPSSKASFGC